MLGLPMGSPPSPAEALDQQNCPRLILQKHKLHMVSWEEERSGLRLFQPCCPLRQLRDLGGIPRPHPAPGHTSGAAQGFFPQTSALRPASENLPMALAISSHSGTIIQGESRKQSFLASPPDSGRDGSQSLCEKSPPLFSFLWKRLRTENWQPGWGGSRTPPPEA